jgi:hypothetical protein
VGLLLPLKRDRLFELCGPPDFLFFLRSLYGSGFDLLNQVSIVFGLLC